MANSRITDASLPEAFNDGDILSSEDLNQIVTVFKNAINYNKVDMDKLLASNEDARVAYDIGTLYDFTGVEGDYAYLYNPEELGDGVRLYEYTSGAWLYVSKLSLIDLYERIADVPEINQIRADMDELITTVGNLETPQNDMAIAGDAAPDGTLFKTWLDTSNRDQYTSEEGTVIEETLNLDNVFEVNSQYDDAGNFKG